MKNIFCIISLLCITAAAAVAQSYTPIGAPNSTTLNKGGLRVDSAGIQVPLLPPTYKQVGKGMGTTGVISASSVDSLPNYLKNGIKKKVLTKWDSGTVYVDAGEVGQPNGVAPLNSSGVVPSANLPAIVVNGQVYVDTSQTQMLSHSAATAGALSIRTDSSNNLYCLVQTPYNVRANWHITQGNGVSAFNSRTGAITPRLGDYNTDSVAEGINHLYFTAARTQTQIAADTGASGFVMSKKGTSDSCAAIRAATSSATVNIGSTVTGSVNKRLFFSKGSKLGQDSHLIYDTATTTISALDTLGGVAASMGIGPGSASGGKIKTLSQGGSIGMVVGTSPDGVANYVEYANSGNSTYLECKNVLASTIMWLRPTNASPYTDSIANLSDIPALATTWVKLSTISYTSFTASAPTQTINSSYTLPAGWVVTSIVINPSTTFSGGGSITGYTISVGGSLSGNTSKFLTATSVFTGSTFVVRTIGQMESFTSNSVITVTAGTAGGGFVNSATQGVLDIYLLVSHL